MNILSFDVGNIQTGVVLFDGSAEQIKFKGKVINNEFFDPLHLDAFISEHGVAFVVVEMLTSNGMPSNQQVLDTGVWVGAIWAIFKNRDIPTYLVYRTTVKLHHCNDMRAGDPNVRGALVSRYGQDHSKKNPNYVYYTGEGNTKMNNDVWAAFALAVYMMDAIKGDVGRKVQLGLREEKSLSWTLLAGDACTTKRSKWERNELMKAEAAKEARKNRK